MSSTGKTAVWIVATGFSAIAIRFYDPALRAYVESFEMGQYSYIIVLAFVTAYILYRLALASSPAQAPVALLQALSGLTASLGLYAASMLSGAYSMNLQILSLALLAWSLLAASGLLSGALLAISLVLLASLTPLPPGLLDRLTAALTGITAPLAAHLAGGVYTSSGGYSLIVIRRSGLPPARLEVAPLCSGVSSLLTVLAITPLAFYIAWRRVSSPWRRVTAAIAAAATGVLVDLIGDSGRIALLARLEAAGDAGGLWWSLAHKGLPAVYVAVASMLTLYVADKLSGPPAPLPVSGRGPSPRVRRRWGPIMAAGLIVAALAGLSLSTNAAGIHINASSRAFVDASSLLEKPGWTVFRETRASIAFETPRPIVGEALGALSVDYVSLRYRGLPAQGYVEVAETPARFHSWFVCLPAQGYRILEHWSSTKGGLTIYYIIASRASSKMLLAYTIAPVDTDAGRLYVKVSLFTPAYGNVYYKASLLGELMRSLPLREAVSSGSTAFKLVRWLLITSILSSLTSLALPFTSTRRIPGEEGLY